MTRRTFRITAALGTLVVAASLTACAGLPGTAATVGSERISVAEVSDTTDALNQVFGPVPALSSYVLNVKMRATAAAQVAGEQGFDLRAAAGQELAAQGASAGTDVPELLRDFATDLTAVEVLSQRVGAAALEQRFAEIPVTVNPRYGLTGLEPVRVDSTNIPLVRNPSLSKPDGEAQ